MNVNVPGGTDRAAIRVAPLGKRRYGEVVVEKLDPRGRPYYWIGSSPPTGELANGTDLAAVAEKYISVTPLHLDLTDYRSIDLLAEIAPGSDVFSLAPSSGRGSGGEGVPLPRPRPRGRGSG